MLTQCRYRCTYSFSFTVSGYPIKPSKTELAITDFLKFSQPSQAKQATVNSLKFKGCKKATSNFYFQKCCKHHPSFFCNLWFDSIHCQVKWIHPELDYRKAKFLNSFKNVANTCLILSTISFRSNAQSTGARTGWSFRMQAFTPSTLKEMSRYWQFKPV